MFAIAICVFAYTNAYSTAYYIQNYNPWGNTDNLTAMDYACGTGNWVQATYSMPVTIIFSATTNFVVLEGSDSNGTYLKNFLSANHEVIESWVHAGGRLFINATPNPDIVDSIDCGFSGILLVNHTSATVNAYDINDTMFHGPHLPVQTTFSGTEPSKALIIGPGLDTVMWGVYPADLVLAKRHWGAGTLIVGTLTTAYGVVQPQGLNLWYNIFDWASTPDTPTVAADSFCVYASHDCGGTSFLVNSVPYYAGMSVKTFFGDNSTDSTMLTPTYPGGSADISHYYAAFGTYAVKQVLYAGALALDSLSFSYTAELCNYVTASCYYDVNGNCTRDGNENIFLQPILIEVDSNNVAIDTLSVMSGFHYTAYGAPGCVYKYKFLSAVGYYATCPPNGIITDTIQPGNNFVVPSLAFGFSCSPGNDFDLAIDENIPVTGILDQWGEIYVRNNYCYPTNATVTLYYSPKYTYNGNASPLPSSVSGNSISWNLSSLSSSDTDPVGIYYQVWYNPATGPVPVGDTVQEHIVVTPSAGDVNTINNTLDIHDTVSGSCDPNHISVVPEGNITAGTNLKYKIEFENVGNDTAFNIRVMDTLPNELDLNSMRMITSSHSIYVSRLADGIHNILQFDFPNIDLLDSSHHGACTGTFTYTINSKSNLPDGTLIDHRAGIYFDYNDVVMTNTAENVIGFPEHVVAVNKLENVRLYPNPASTQLTIRTVGNGFTSFTITNNLGQVVLKQDINSTQTKVNVKQLPAGMYYVNLKGVNGSDVRKFVKM